MYSVVLLIYDLSLSDFMTWLLKLYSLIISYFILDDIYNVTRFYFLIKLMFNFIYHQLYSYKILEK